MNIKELRNQYKLTQLEASKLTGIPLRTFKLYENDESKVGTIKYDYILDKLNKYGFVDETHGVLSFKQIKEGATKVMSEYDVNYLILFGSYARGTAVPTSDIDLVISTNVGGLKFFGIVEKLRQTLKKNIDLLDLKQLSGNPELINNVLGEGIRIYVQNK